MEWPYSIWKWMIKQKYMATKTFQQSAFTVLLELLYKNQRMSFKKGLGIKKSYNKRELYMMYDGSCML